MKRDFLPIALGFWGVAIPLLLSVFLYCRTPAERITVGLSSCLFLMLGFLVYKAKT